MNNDKEKSILFSPRLDYTYLFLSGISIPFLQVCSSGLIEDQSSAALEVDFANKYIGGGALHSGCVQVCFK